MALQLKLSLHLQGGLIILCMPALRSHGSANPECSVNSSLLTVLCVNGSSCLDVSISRQFILTITHNFVASNPWLLLYNASPSVQLSIFISHYYDWALPFPLIHWAENMVMSAIFLLNSLNWCVSKTKSSQYCQGKSVKLNITCTNPLLIKAYT